VLHEYKDFSVTENSSAEPSTGDCKLPDGPEAWWARLLANPNDQDAVEMLVRHYNPLVSSELSRARARLPAYVSRDELEIAGSEGLFMAVTG
jgi:DNA-directed RNA polymerase specialized sigma subunit